MTALAEKALGILFEEPPGSLIAFALRLWSHDDDITDRILQSDAYARRIAGSYLGRLRSWGFIEKQGGSWRRRPVPASLPLFRDKPPNG